MGMLDGGELHSLPGYTAYKKSRIVIDAAFSFITLQP